MEGIMEKGSHSTGASVRAARAAGRLPREGSGGQDICVLVVSVPK